MESRESHGSTIFLISCMYSQALDHQLPLKNSLTRSFILSSHLPLILCGGKITVAICKLSPTLDCFIQLVKKQACLNCSLQRWMEVSFPLLPLTSLPASSRPQVCRSSWAPARKAAGQQVGVELKAYPVVVAGLRQVVGVEVEDRTPAEVVVAEVP